MACIDVCRQLDASPLDPSQPDTAEPDTAEPDTVQPNTSQPDALQAGAGASEPAAACPVGPFPCERLCWELDARFGRGEPIIGVDLNAESDVDLAALGEPYMRCAQAGAAECRANTVAGPTSGLPVSWTSLFLQCAGLPAGLDLSD